jgi:3-hydroxymyristoyl/3-hydroxydecanoyl-(acyl carrier protein) dehydratase
MNGHFRAFSFVDQITGLRPGISIEGRYLIPPEVNTFPSSLVAEAVGQLAAWGAMAAVDFLRRPVAGIAGMIELLAPALPGQVLELRADLESVDIEAVAYSGSAHMNGASVVRLRDCVGPMVPVADFDDPQALRDRFSLLSAAGAMPGGFEGLPNLGLQPNGGEKGRCARTCLSVPIAVPFFADHFPRRPVFPGTLLMHANIETAENLASQVPLPNGAEWRTERLSDLKLRTFIAPGETVEIEAKWIEQSEHGLSVTVESRIARRLVSSAEIHFVPEVDS